jgi:hypothetical protein
MIALRNAYHGETLPAWDRQRITLEVNVPHSFGFIIFSPDPYRGQWNSQDPTREDYAADVKNLIDYATPGRSGPHRRVNPGRWWLRGFP